MPETLPSDNVAIIDVPEVENLAVEFIYNFFTPDERVNRQGSLPNFIHQRPGETFDTFYVDRSKALPRLIRIDWSPITTNRRRDIPVDTKIGGANFRKIHSEESFTSDRYTTIHYQDQEIDRKYRFFALRSLREFENGRPPAAQSSPFDLATLVNTHTPDQVTADFLHEALSIDPTGLSHGVRFIPHGTDSSLINNGLESLKDVRVNVRINNKVLTQLIQTARENTIGVFPNERQSEDFNQELLQRQNQAIAATNSSIIDQHNFEFEVQEYIDIRPVDTNGYTPVIECVGYVIDKVEYLTDGTILASEPTIIESPFTAVTFDGQIRYGATYGYKIRSVFFVEIQAQEVSTNNNVLVTFLVASQISPEVRVVTEESIPPPPPADFNVAWDYGERALRITWNLPPNTQRDIKYFQLFRRKTIYEPFQMLKMWDFNDSQVNDPTSGLVIGYHEIPDITLIDRDTNSPPRPTGFFLDREFTKDSNFIYTIAAIDAHGFSSNYSLQFQANFDKFTNRLVKRMVSRSGAPKAYPNAYLNQDTFVDTIKDSGHSKALVVFNPDFLTLLDNSGNDFRALKTSIDNGRYRLQLINVDLQTQRSVDFFIEDRRTTLRRINYAPITSLGQNGGNR